MLLCVSVGCLQYATLETPGGERLIGGLACRVSKRQVRLGHLHAPVLKACTYFQGLLDDIIEAERGEVSCVGGLSVSHCLLC